MKLSYEQKVYAAKIRIALWINDPQTHRKYPEMIAGRGLEIAEAVMNQFVRELEFVDTRHLKK
jgi:hypothetical protein